MKRVELVHQGHIAANGFIVDTPVIGEDQARSRILEILGPSDRLVELPDGRWLLLTPTTHEVDSCSAPGAVLAGTARSRVAAPGLEPVEGVTEFRCGQIVHRTIDDLPPVDIGSWFDLGPTLRLDPIGPDGVDNPVAIAADPRPGDRSSLGIPDLPAEASAIVDQVTSTTHLRNSKPDQVAAQPSSRAARRRRSPVGRRSMIAEVSLRLAAITPLRGLAARRSAAYIDELLGTFRCGDVDEALHRALPLGDGVGEALSAAFSLKLPARRDHLSISSLDRRQTRSMEISDDRIEQLRVAYERAAQGLEAEGRLEHAVFVLAELLGRPDAAVALLERNGSFERAARLAEHFELDGATIARLWWLAGDSHRAIRSLRCTWYPLLLQRLDSTDPASADDLRRAWIADRLRLGDVLGAVETAWRHPELHSMVAEATLRDAELGGPVGGVLRVYALALDPTHERLEQAIDLVRHPDGRDVEHDVFVRAFSEITIPDVRIDRCIASEITRRRLLGSSGDETSTQWGRIRRRADPVLLADLASSRRPTHDDDTPLELPRLPPGQLTITDAATRTNGEILVALGPIGARLLRDPGRIVAQWHAPTTRIVMSDHSGVALLIDERSGGEVDVRRLDLTTFRLEFYGTMRLRSFAESFDGVSWIVVDADGPAVLDLDATHPTITRRPLEGGTVCHSILRTRESVIALVSNDRLGWTELRSWTPDMTRLTRRSEISFRPDAAPYQLVKGGLLIDWGTHITIDDTWGRTHTLDAHEQVDSCGDLIVRQVVHDDGRWIRVDGASRPVVQQYLLDHEPVPRFRSCGSLLTAWYPDGTAHGVDIGRRRLISSVRTHL